MIYYSGGTLLIRQFYQVGEQLCDEGEYDIFSIEADPQIQEALNRSDSDFLERYQLLSSVIRELCHTFSSYTETAGKKLYIAVGVISETDYAVRLNLWCPPRFKLWLDSRCIAICSTGGGLDPLIFLSEGRHTFLIEQYAPESSDSFALQLREEKQEDCERWVRDHSEPLFVGESPFFPKSDSYRFMYLFPESARYLHTYHVSSYDDIDGLIFESDAKANTVMEIPLTGQLGASYELEKYGPHIWNSCRFNTIDGESSYTQFTIIPQDNQKAIRFQLQRAAELPIDPNSYEGLQLWGEMDRLQTAVESSQTWAAYCLLVALTDRCDRLEKGEKRGPEHQSAGIHELYIRSRLDDSIIWLLINLPDNFDPRREYPLVLYLSYNQYSWNGCEIDRSAIEEEFIHIDVSGRGAGSGSYMAEASFFEILEWAKQTYRIDEERIYLAGYSSGGYSVWALAQNHPDLAAAILPIAGFPEIDRVSNLTNVPVFTTISRLDYVNSQSEVQLEEAMSGSRLFMPQYENEMLHQHLREFGHSSQLYNKMMKYRRNSYPREIHYSTERNRYLQSFWVRLHGICRGEHKAEIHARLTDSRHIDVDIQGSEGLTIELPPDIDRAHFTVCVNKQIFEFHDVTQQKLFFTHRNVWLNNPEDNCDVDLRKGTGLLDIYLDSMRIVLPNNPDSRLVRVAKGFSRPNVNGYDSIVYTRYPIYTMPDVPKNIMEHNLLVMDINADNPLMQSLKQQCMVHAGKTEVSYHGLSLTGSYCVMQVIPNPMNRNRTCLIIETNDPDSLSHNLFTRKLIIPTYSSGIHPYLNNEALIWIDGEYYGIYERDGALVKIK